MSGHHAVTNALSFDLEEWFQAEVFSSIFTRERWDGLESRSEAQTDYLLAVLAGKKVRATFFVLGWLAERKPSLIRRIVSEGHELACHGYSHTMICRQSREEFSEDVERARGVLESAAGRGIVGYRAPTFSITPGTLWALDILLGCGFLYDSSVYPIRHDRYGIPGAPRFPHVALIRDGRTLWEFPGPTVRIAGLTLPAAGGGYLRLFPYSWTRMAVNAANRSGRPMNIYAHPWEFDAGIPFVRLPFVLSHRHYGGISGNAGKLSRLLDEFRFAPVGEVLKSMEGRS